MKTKIKRIVSAFLSVIVLASPALFSSCSASKDEYTTFDFFALDTYIALKLSNSSKNGGRLTEEDLTDISKKCADIIADVDAALSSYNTESEVYFLNGKVDMLLSPSEIFTSAYEAAYSVNALTDGAYDYTLGALTEIWNVNGGGPVPKPEDITAALTHTGSDKFTLAGDSVKKSDPDAKIDFGGIGKGVAAQRILEYLDSTDVKYALISIGGNVGVIGEKKDSKTYKIGIRDPQKSDAVIGYIYIPSGFVSVSGDYERFFEEDGKKYHHIMDPKTGYPADTGLSSVAVYAQSGASADALSTALFVMGLDGALDFYETRLIPFEAIFVTSDGQVVLTPGLGEEDFIMTSSDYKLVYKEENKK